MEYKLKNKRNLKKNVEIILQVGKVSIVIVIEKIFKIEDITLQFVLFKKFHV